MANPLARKVPSRSAVSTSPLPGFTCPPLPEKIRKIDPEGATAWEATLTGLFQERFRRLEEKLNAAIDAQKTGT